MIRNLDPNSPPLLSIGIEADPQWTRRDLSMVAGLILAGLVLRIPGIDEGLWLDEIMTLVQYVRAAPWEIIRQGESLNNHVLYSLAAHYSVSWLGETAWTLRLPALVFGVATLPALYHLGLQIATRQEAGLATLFLALNYHHVWFSQNARGYTGLLLAAVVATSLFIRLLGSRSPSAGWIFGYAAVVALAIGLHLTGAVILLAHALVWLYLASRAVNRERPGAASASRLALLLGAFFSLASNAPSFSGMLARTLEPRILLDSPGTGALAGQAAVSNPVAFPPIEMFVEGLVHSVPGGWVLVLLGLAALAVGFGSYVRQSPALAALLLLPAVLGLGLVAASSLPIFPRFLFSSAAFFVLLAVRGGFALAGKCIPFLSSRQITAFGCAVALAGASTVPAAWHPKQDFTAAARFLTDNRLPGDAIACMGGSTYLPLARYLGLACELVRTPAQLDALKQRHERVWLVYTLPRPTARSFPELWGRVHQPGAFRSVKTFGATVAGGEIRILLSPDEGLHGVSQDATVDRLRIRARAESG